MYKEIGRFGFEAYTFIPKIETVISFYINDLMEQFEYSLYKNCAYGRDGLEKKEVKNVINSEVGFNVNINLNAALSLLSEIFSEKMEEYMVVPIKNMETERSQLKVKMSFEDFAIQKDDLINPNSLKEELELLWNDEKPVNRLGYFKLYKARNLIVSQIENRMYSKNTLKKTISELEKNFRQLLYVMIIRNEKDRLETATIKAVLDKLFDSYVSQFLNDQRLGKTEEEGNKLVSSLKEQMRLEEIRENFYNVTFQKFNEEFHELLEIKNYIKFSKLIISTLELELKNATGIYQKLRVDFFSNFLIFALGEIFSNCQDVEKLVIGAYKNITDELKEKTVQSVIEGYLSVGNLTFAIRASDLSIQKKFHSIRLTKNIEVMSHALFNAWQFEQLTEMGIDRNPTIVDVQDEEKTNTVWFVISDIKCSNWDTDLGYELAKKELENYLEFSYYFLAREDEYNFKIVDPYICYNMETKKVSLGRKNKPIHSPKEIETFPKELLDFSMDLFESKQPLHLKTMECISLYYKMINKTIGYDQPQILLKIWEILFDTEDIREISSYASIVIAGTNYKKGDITYGDMRRILFEDFIEFISYVKDNRSAMLVDIIYERFKVFTKNIIGTVLFNIPLQSSRMYEIQELFEWILYINPNKENIARRGTDGE